MQSNPRFLEMVFNQEPNKRLGKFGKGQIFRNFKKTNFWTKLKNFANNFPARNLEKKP